jgi:peptidoglycan/xylan/chitin deacetylase (PgdA/CDA1 family)
MNLFPILRRLRSRLSARAHQATSTELLEIYGARASRAGFKHLYLFLSFDCDTDLDIAAVPETHQFLTDLGIKATYAVPGAQLGKGAPVYRKLAVLGAEFMNHGGLPHAEWREDQWVGITFYNRMDDAEVVADIRRGHDIVTSVIGAAPRGFRAPHFGSYQQPKQLALVRATAAELGYSYCSTTTPAIGLEKGPAYLTHGLIELPCFGSARYPRTLLDSWTYLTDRKQYALGDDYYELFAETVTTMLERRIPGVLTWYADPCHVLNQAPFIKAMELAVKRGIRSVTGSECAAMARRHLL